jgi:hypothetical protein
LLHQQQHQHHQHKCVSVCLRHTAHCCARLLYPRDMKLRTLYILHRSSAAAVLYSADSDSSSDWLSRRVMCTRAYASCLCLRFFLCVPPSTHECLCVCVCMCRAQDDSDFFGESLHLFKATNLNNATFLETYVQSIEPSGNGNWYSARTHHVDVQQVRECV